MKKNSAKKPKILVLYYSLYGHLQPMAEAVARGIEMAGGEPIVRQVGEMIPRKLWNTPITIAKKKMKKIAIADPETALRGIDGVIVGTPTHFGSVSAQMKMFWDQTTPALSEGALNGKPAGVFSSSATQHGGNEMVLMHMITILLHHGCLITGLPFRNKMADEGLKLVDEVSGGSPYGATTITGPMGERMPSQNELMLAKVLGQNVTLAASKLMIN